jgi:hypothetical protein
MKVAITCDHIVERKPVHRLIELACSMFPDATIYTFAHLPGKVLGSIEMHSIRSSFLSNLVKSEDEFRRKSYLIPVAAKKLSIPCSIDLIINFSSGFSHGISHCKKTSVLNYFFSNDLNLPTKTISEKVFNSYLKSWAKRYTDLHSHKVQSHENLSPGLEVLRPFYNFEDYQFHNNEPSGDLALINPGHLSQQELERLTSGLCSKNMEVIILGDSTGIKGVEYLKNGCSGELTPLFERAKVIVEGNNKSFPEFGLSSFASGRSIWVKSSVISQSFLGRDLPMLFNNVNEVIDGKANSIDRSKYRDHAARYSQLLFKTGLMRQLKNMGHQYRPQK